MSIALAFIALSGRANSREVSIVVHLFWVKCNTFTLVVGLLDKWGRSCSSWGLASGMFENRTLMFLTPRSICSSEYMHLRIGLNLG